jgi:hypothetical protein
MKPFAGICALGMSLTLAAAPPAARLDGMLLDVDSRPARGHAVYLIDPHGRPVSRAVTADDGQYSFPDLAAGQYTMGIESPDGRVSPVAGPPLELRGGELARRDVKLYESDAETQGAAVRANFGFLTWWHGLSLPAKIGMGLGVFFGGVVLAKSLESDDSGAPRLDEMPSSPSDVPDGNP